MQLYSIASTANVLKPYNYFEYHLTEISEHLEDTKLSFCEVLFS